MDALEIVLRRGDQQVELGITAPLVTRADLGAAPYPDRDVAAGGCDDGDGRSATRRTVVATRRLSADMRCSADGCGFRSRPGSGP